MNFLSIFLKYSFMKIVKYVREVGPWAGSNPFCPYPDPSPPPQKKSKETKELIRWFFGDCPSKKLNDNKACGG